MQICLQENQFLSRSNGSPPVAYRKCNNESWKDFSPTESDTCSRGLWNCILVYLLIYSFVCNTNTTETQVTTIRTSSASFKTVTHMQQKKVWKMSKQPWSHLPTWWRSIPSKVQNDKTTLLVRLFLVSAPRLETQTALGKPKQKQTPPETSKWHKRWRLCVTSVVHFLQLTSDGGLSASLVKMQRLLRRA